MDQNISNPFHKLPSGTGSIELNTLFGHRMYKPDMPRMQTDTGIGVGTREAVLQIAFNGATHLCQLTPNLMMTTCLEGLSPAENNCPNDQSADNSESPSCCWAPPYRRHSFCFASRCAPGNAPVRLRALWVHSSTMAQ